MWFYFGVQIQTELWRPFSQPFWLCALLFTFVPHVERLLTESSINTTWCHILRGNKGLSVFIWEAQPAQTPGFPWSDCVSLTMTVRVGSSLGAFVSVDTCEVKSRLELTAFFSEEPRSIGWSILVRLMVLWLLNGREGWSLSQSACRQCKGRK